MKTVKSWGAVTVAACIALLLCVGAGLGITVSHAYAEEATDDLYTVKTYVPETGDFVDYWRGISTIPMSEGGGVRTFAHTAMTVPMKGTEIEMKTSFMLYSKRTQEEGGDNIDAWCTYSFSANPAGEADNTFPSYSGIVSGYFLHITNYSSTKSPNCVEVQVVECEGSSRKGIKTFFLDNAVTKVDSADPIVFTLSLTKVADYNYTLSFRLVDGTLLSEQKGLELDDELFINEDGQTFFGTALYEKQGACNGEHWNHRAVNIYSVQAYTCSASAAEITLDKDAYVWEEGGVYKPSVTVKANGRTLAENESYYLRYYDNKEVGTGKVTVCYINDYAGNPSVTKEFTIASASGNGSEGNGTTKGCNGAVVGGALLPALVLLAGAGILLARTKSKTQRKNS